MDNPIGSEPSRPMNQKVTQPYDYAIDSPNCRIILTLNQNRTLNFLVVKSARSTNNDIDQSDADQTNQHRQIMTEFYFSSLLATYPVLCTGIPENVCIIAPLYPYGSLADLICMFKEHGNTNSPSIVDHSFSFMNFLQSPATYSFPDGNKLLFITDILLQIAYGINFLRENDLIHRDIKPENILIDLNSAYPHGIIGKIIDYGLLKRVITTTFTGSGTAGLYHPPEWKDTNRLPNYDIWSLGILIFDLLRGFNFINYECKPYETEETLREYFLEQLGKLAPNQRLDEDISECVSKFIGLIQHSACEHAARLDINHFIKYLIEISTSLGKLQNEPDSFLHNIISFQLTKQLLDYPTQQPKTTTFNDVLEAGLHNSYLSLRLISSLQHTHSSMETKHRSELDDALDLILSEVSTQAKIQNLQPKIQSLQPATERAFHRSTFSSAVVNRPIKD